MKRTTKTLAAVGATLLLSSFGLASTTMAQDGGPDDNNPPETASDTRAVTSETMETSFVPVKPCRLFDTRNTGGPMTNTQTRNFSVKGTLGSQGGVADCGIPEGATAASINLTAISQSGTSGFVRGWAAGGSQSTSTLLNFSPALNASNSVEVPLCEGSCTNDITLKTFGSAHLVGEVLGYYIPQIHAEVSSAGNITESSPRVTGVRRSSRGRYYVSVDRDVSECTAIATTSDEDTVVNTAEYSDGTVVVAPLKDGRAIDVPLKLLVSC